MIYNGGLNKWTNRIRITVDIKADEVFDEPTKTVNLLSLFTKHQNPP